MQLKGTKSGSNGTTKTRRPVNFKVRVLQLKAEGKSAKEALELACQEAGTVPTAGMLKHPHSFVNMYKASVNKGLKAENKAVEALVVAAGLAEDSPSPVAPQAEVAEEPEIEEDEAEEFEPEEDDSES